MKTKILIVDDETELLQSLGSWLEDEGFETYLAANEDEFRQLALQKTPNLIILDILLGAKNGIDIYEKLLRQGLNRKTPVIFLSGLAKDSVPTPAAAPGRTYVLHAKPFVTEDLVKDIRCLVRN